MSIVEFVFFHSMTYVSSFREILKKSLITSWLLPNEESALALENHAYSTKSIRNHNYDKERNKVWIQIAIDEFRCVILGNTLKYLLKSVLEYYRVCLHSHSCTFLFIPWYISHLPFDSSLFGYSSSTFH